MFLALNKQLYDQPSDSLQVHISIHARQAWSGSRNLNQNGGLSWSKSLGRKEGLSQSGSESVRDGKCKNRGAIAFGGSSQSIFSKFIFNAEKKVVANTGFGHLSDWIDCLKISIRFLLFF